MGAPSRLVSLIFHDLHMFHEGLWACIRSSVSVSVSVPVSVPFEPLIMHCAALHPSHATHILLIPGCIHSCAVFMRCILSLLSSISHAATQPHSLRPS